MNIIIKNECKKVVIHKTIHGLLQCIAVLSVWDPTDVAVSATDLRPDMDGMKLSVSVRGAVRMPMHRAKVATDKLAVLFVEYDNVVTLADMQPWLHVSKSDSCY